MAGRVPGPWGSRLIQWREPSVFAVGVPWVDSMIRRLSGGYECLGNGGVRLALAESTTGDGDLEFGTPIDARRGNYACLVPPRRVFWAVTGWLASR